jgi:hypothetical protein
MATRKKRFPKKKRVEELPDREVIHRVFPKKVVDELDRVAHKGRTSKGTKDGGSERSKF